LLLLLLLLQSAPWAVTTLQVINLNVTNRLAKLVERHGPAAAESVTTVVRAQATVWCMTC
jgi:predicted P-loop ATPase/GTPase